MAQGHCRSQLQRTNAALGTLSCQSTTLNSLLRRIRRYQTHHPDTNYMNDLWSFDTTTMLWEEQKTTGIIPSQRSNCTLHYN